MMKIRNYLILLVMLNLLSVKQLKCQTFADKQGFHQLNDFIFFTFNICL